MKKVIFAVFVTALFVSAVLLCVEPKWYLKNIKYQPEAEIVNRLRTTGDSALISADIPVAALLLYKNEVIGTGYNTVRRDATAGGHAEINAISGAMKRVGVDSFWKIDRSQLTLITTWEPCPMCKGAILEYNIRHVVVVKSKSLSYWYRQWKKSALYEWDKQYFVTDTLQENLFKRHPLYSEQKP